MEEGGGGRGRGKLGEGHNFVEMKLCSAQTYGNYLTLALIGSIHFFFFYRC